MNRQMLKSKLHRVTLTECHLDYEGSCAIDNDLLEAADILENERIDIWNINNGERFFTYALVAQRGSGIISLNGSAARRAAVGDLLIIASFGSYSDKEITDYKPKLVYVNQYNHIKKTNQQTISQESLASLI